MAMTGNGLSNHIKSAIRRIPEADRDGDRMWDAIGNAIIEYIKQNGEIRITAPLSTPPVSPGAPTNVLPGQTLPPGCIL